MNNADDWLDAQLLSTPKATKVKVNPPLRTLCQRPSPLVNHRNLRPIRLGITNRTCYDWEVIVCAILEEGDQRRTPHKLKCVVVRGETSSTHWQDLTIDQRLILLSIEARCTLEQSPLRQMYCASEATTSPPHRTFFQSPSGSTLDVQLGWTTSTTHVGVSFPSIVGDFKPT